MKQLFLALILLPSVIFAGERIEVELSSNEVISIDTFKADGETLYLYLPSERGFGKGYVPTAQQLAFSGYDVWALDLHSSYMVPKHRSSIDKFDIDDLTELVYFTEQQGFKKLFFITSGRGSQLALKVARQWQLKYPDSDYIKGHIFHSPHLIQGKPRLGNKADYVDIAKSSNLPVYLLMPQYGTKYFRTQEITNTLDTGGSAVFVHRFKGVHGGFHMRNESDLSKADMVARDNLDDTYIQASNLLSSVDPPLLLTLLKHREPESNYIFSDPKLTPYKGKRNIDLNLKDLVGKKISLKDFKDKVVLINFWASWCKPCVKEIPSLVRLSEKFSKNEFEIITVNVGESINEITEFKKKVGFELLILLDSSGEAVKDWGVYAYPSNFLLDKNGVIRYGYRGALEWDSPSVVNTIKDLL